MYANLEVRIAKMPAARYPHGSLKEHETLYAWNVVFEPEAHRAIVYLDANDGEGNYAEEAGTRIVTLNDHAMEISARF